MTHVSLAYEQLKVDLQAVYEFMGYRDNAPDKTIQEETENILREISAFLKPSFCYTVVNGSLDMTSRHLKLSSPDGVVCEEFEIGKIISHQIKGAERFAVFVCTAGQAFQKYQERLMEERDMLRVYIADAIGSTLAECCADVMESTLQKSIDKLSWKRTNRYSPGYCGWHVREQKKLFMLLPKEPCGVHLTESCLMMPIKSVSGIIALGDDVKYNEYTCGLCNFEKCYKRKKR